MTTILQPKDETGVPEGFEIVDIDDTVDDTGLLSVLGELGVEDKNDILLKIYRINDMGKEAHCFDALPDAINGIEDRLRDSYGKGDYKIKVFTPTPHGGKSVKKHINLSIEIPKEGLIPPVDNSGKDMETIVSTMMASMQSNTNNMMQMFKESQLESQNGMLKMMLEMNKPDPNAEKQPTIVEQLALLKQLIPAPEKTIDPMTMLNQMMEMHRNVKEEFSDDKPEDAGVMGQLLSGMNGLVDLAKNAPALPAPVGAIQPPMKPTHLNGEKPVVITPEQEQEKMNFIIKAQLKKHLDFLITKAAADKNVDVYADLTIEEIPEKYYPQLLGAIGDNNDHSFKALMEINPAIEPYKEWFDAFCDSIRSFFSAVDEDNLDNGLTDDLPEIEDLTNDTEKGDDSETETINSEVSDNNADKSGEKIAD